MILHILKVEIDGEGHQTQRQIERDVRLHNFSEVRPKLWQGGRQAQAARLAPDGSRQQLMTPSAIEVIP